jgi:hypothetical protein
MREQVKLHNYNIKSMTVYVNQRLRGAMNNKANKNKYSSKIKSIPSLLSMESNNNYNNISQSSDNQNNGKLNPNNGKLRTVSFASETTTKSKHSGNSSNAKKSPGKSLLKNGNDSHEKED